MPGAAVDSLPPILRQSIGGRRHLSNEAAVNRLVFLMLFGRRFHRYASLRATRGFTLLFAAYMGRESRREKGQAENSGWQR
jgi:hypothetical protein